MNLNTAPRSTASPFLNDYKLKFVGRRLLQTFLGGLLLKFESDNETPWFIYVLQLVLFFVPFVYGGVFILAADLSAFSRVYLSVIAGAIYAACVFTLKSTLLIVSNKIHLKNEKKRLEKLNKTPLGPKVARSSGQNSHRTSQKSSLFNDEQLYEFGDCCSFATLNFLLPPLEFLIQINSTGRLEVNKLKLLHSLVRIFCDAIVAGFMMYCSVSFESIVYLQAYYSLGGSVCVFILSWIVLCLGFYSLCVREPAEPAVYQPYDQFNIQHYHRAFYIICFQLIEIIYK